MKHSVYMYFFVMAAVTFAVRAIPVTLIQKQIKNKFIKSFLYYVPYATLSVMTFPAIVTATQSAVSGWLALAVGAVTAWLGGDLFKVAVSCCSVVFLAELFIV